MNTVEAPPSLITASNQDEEISFLSHFYIFLAPGLIWNERVSSVNLVWKQMWVMICECEQRDRLVQELCRSDVWVKSLQTRDRLEVKVREISLQSGWHHSSWSVFIPTGKTGTRGFNLLKKEKCEIKKDLVLLVFLFHQLGVKLQKTVILYSFFCRITFSLVFKSIFYVLFIYFFK